MVNGDQRISTPEFCRLSESKLKEVLEGFNSGEEAIVAKNILYIKRDFGVASRYEAQGNEEMSKFFRERAKGRRDSVKKYATKKGISDKRFKEIERTIYDRETTL